MIQGGEDAVRLPNEALPGSGGRRDSTTAVMRWLREKTGQCERAEDRKPSNRAESTRETRSPETGEGGVSIEWG